MRLAAEEYEAIRRDPRRFVNAPEHESNGLGWCRVVHEFDRYTVVEKIGEAGELAEALDPRTREGS